MLKEGTKELRQVYVETLLAMAEDDKDIIVMESDLSNSMGTKKFQEMYPDQYINCGIMEANMIGVSAGLSLLGKKPFIHSFAAFISRRAYDQIFISLAYSQLNATLIGSDPGITGEFNGGTHMALEDMGLMRLIPNAIVCEASDEHMLQSLLKLSSQEEGLWYIRTPRKKLPQIYKPNEIFEIGKGKLIKTGENVLFISSGITMEDSIIAAEILEKEDGLDIGIIDMFCLKPIDRTILENYLQKSALQLIVTIENHQNINGLGSAVGEILAEKGAGIPCIRLGIQNQFGQIGSIDYLKDIYGYNKNSIIQTVRKFFDH